MAEDPKMRAYNEYLRRKKLADREEASKKHRAVMDKVARGGKEAPPGCVGMLALFAFMPAGLYFAQAMLRL